ncbi:NADH-quinone oxidoreductase subunit J family protein [Desulfogranum mediterraneum]|uniref:NADH-quinone oxidoreductase subunit J family protein n=1 Tax=Desulfogranum mediterraneum TaxID=160661 RepID=UPI0004022FED|nr:NADH-quinone oxidoreductase subunit J [Desulfogranum mediterraneum]
MQPLVWPPMANPTLFSLEGAVGIIFLLTIALVVTGGLIAVVSQRLVRAVSGLAICFTGLAGVYYFLLSPFVAMMQLLIYVGAVSILIAFGIMMATPEQEIGPGNAWISRLVGPLGASVGGLFFAALTILGLKTPWQVFPRTAEASGDIEQVGKTLLTSHSMVFELISIVLLMAIIGALVIARRGRN